MRRMAGVERGGNTSIKLGKRQEQFVRPFLELGDWQIVRHPDYSKDLPITTELPEAHYAFSYRVPFQGNIVGTPALPIGRNLLLVYQPPDIRQPSPPDMTPREQYLFGDLSPDLQTKGVEQLRQIEASPLVKLDLLRYGLPEFVSTDHGLSTFEQALALRKQKAKERHRTNFKVLVIVSPDEEGNIATANKGAYPPLGAWRVATWVKMKGADVQLLDGTIMTEEEIVDFVRKYKPDLTGISVLSPSVKPAMNISRVAKELGSVVCWGNDHPSPNAVQTMEGREMVDVVLRGDGADRWFGELVEVVRDDKDIASIPSASWRVQNGIRNSSHMIYDIGEAPIPYSSVIPLEQYAIYMRNFQERWNKWFSTDTVPALTNFVRGCHWGGPRCSYCDINDLRLQFTTDPYRVWNEVRFYNRQYGANLMYEVGDNFTSFTLQPREIFRRYGVAVSDRPSWVEEVIAARPAEFGPDGKNPIGWFVYGRADDIVRPGVAELLKDFNVKRLNVGIDHFDDEILNRGLNKGNRHGGQTNREAIKTMAEFGFQGHFSFVLGAPGETPESLAKLREGILWTIDTMGDRLATLDANALIPLRGNAVYNRLVSSSPVFAEKYGDADTIDYEELAKDAIRIYAPKVTWEEVSDTIDWIDDLCSKHGIVPAAFTRKSNK